VDTLYMKKLISISALLFTLALSQAQDKPETKASVEVQKDAGEGDKIVLTPPKIVTGKPGETQITYGGFLADLAKGNKPAKLIDPRNPAKTKANADNVYTDTQTGKIRGFVLFAIKF
jgi:ABC-type Fe3+-hydroxamate transport system substrate-binding protein